MKLPGENHQNRFYKNEIFHKVVEEIEDYALFLLDKDGNIMTWNKGAERIKGYGAEEVIGKNFGLFYSPENQSDKLPEKLLDEATKNGKANYEGWRIKKDGSTFWGS